jgi:hypothetical protein
MVMPFDFSILQTIVANASLKVVIFKRVILQGYKNITATVCGKQLIVILFNTSCYILQNELHTCYNEIKKLPGPLSSVQDFLLIS